MPALPATWMAPETPPVRLLPDWLSVYCSSGRVRVKQLP